MLEINDGHKQVKQKMMDSGTEYSQEEDIVEERRKIFGEDATITQQPNFNEDES